MAIDGNTHTHTMRSLPLHTIPPLMPSRLPSVPVIHACYLWQQVYIGPQQYFVITDIGRGNYQWYVTPRLDFTRLDLTYDAATPNGGRAATPHPPQPSTTLPTLELRATPDAVSHQRIALTLEPVHHTHKRRSFPQQLLVGGVAA
jgi:hypothetical protein